MILDASVALAWLLPDEASELASAVIREGIRTRLRAPSLLLPEVANALRSAERRGRLEATDRQKLLDRFLSLPILLEPVSAQAIQRADQLAARHAITVYDACYLELAALTDDRIATFDVALALAARAEAIELVVR